MQNGTREAIRQQMTALPGWYHDIDLGQGLVTPGRGLAELWNLNRRLMDLVEFRDKAVLDIGAMDGMWSFESERRGAALVIATDAYEWGHRRFMFCKEVLGSRAVPYFDVSVYQLAEALERVSAPARKFDVVICFGVLYHLRDPMLALTQIRSVLKEDGIALFETAYFHSRDPVMYFNTGGKLFYDDVTTWWAPSYPCLEAMCAASLLRASRPAGADFQLRARRNTVGRTAFLAHPTGEHELDARYAEAIRDHYHVRLRET